MKRVNRIWIKLISIVIVLIMFIPPISISSDAYDYEDDCRVIVSMGDSYSSGEGLGSYYGGELEEEKKKKDQDFLSHRSKESWPAMLKTKTGSDQTMVTQRKDNWYFVAMSGAITDNITDDSELPERITYKIYKEKKYRFKDYYNVYRISNNITYEVEERTAIDPQINIFKDSSLKSKEIDYVTLTIGGNDAKFTEILATVVKPACLCPKAIDKKIKKIRATFPEIIEDLKKTYRLISSKAGESATIIVADYPQLLDDSGKGTLVSKHEAETVNNAVSEFNRDVIAKAVKECRKEGLKIELVSVEEKFKTHGAYSDEPWINGYDYSIKEDDISDFNIFNGALISASSFHPNKTGAEKYAELINEKMDELDKEKNRDPITVIVPDTDEPPADDTEETVSRVQGEWILDVDMTHRNNEDSVEMYFGNLCYLNSMTFNENGDFSWWIGVNGGEGMFRESENNVEVVYAYPDTTHYSQSTIDFLEVSGDLYLIMDHGGYETYWKKGTNSTGDNERPRISLEHMPIVAHSSYQDNEGDSTVFNLSANGLTQCDDGRTYKRYGNIGVDGTVFNNGFEVWIARWNYKNEISWASATFDLGGKYKTLTGKTNLIKSYNTTNFDTTVYFYDGEKLLASYRLTDTDYIKDIAVDVTGVNHLKLYVKDNISAKGGTSFALYDMFFSDKAVHTHEISIPSDVFEYNGHYYKVFLNSEIGWNEAKQECETLGGHLVTITSEEENDFVYSLVQHYDRSFWIGATDEAIEGTWVWVTDERWDYENALFDNRDNLQHYLTINYRNSKTWDDQSEKSKSNNGLLCDTQGYICEWDQLPE